MKMRIELRHPFILLLIYTLLSVMCSANAQQVNHAIWTGVEAEFKLTKKWNISFEEQLRIEGKPYFFNQLLSEVGIEYKLSKYLRPSVSYRRTFVSERYWTDRMDFNVKLRLKLGKWKIQDRIKFQTDFGRTEPDLYKLRNKLEFEYKVKKKIVPFIFCDSFYSFAPEFQRIYKIRIGGGVDLGIGKKNALKFFSFFQTGDIYSVVTGLNYSRQLN